MTFSECRKKLKLSLYKIQKETGLAPSTIRELERNTSSSRLSTIELVTKLGFTITCRNGEASWSIN